MKSIISIILILFTVNLVAQNPVNATFKGFEDGPYNEYFGNGQLRLSCVIKNGNIHGNYTSYYKNGQLRAIDSFKNGKFHGPNIAFDKKGGLTVDEYHLSDTLIYYVEFDYYKSGELKSERSIQFNKDSVMANSFIDAKDKVLKRIIQYDVNKSVEGFKSIGMYREFYKDCGVRLEEPLVNNERNGLSHTYYEDGEVCYEYNCKDCYLDGKSDKYDKTGKLIKTELWAKGKKSESEKK